MKPQVHEGPPRHNRPRIPGPQEPPAKPGRSESSDKSDLVDAVLDVAGESQPPEILRRTVEKALYFTDARHAEPQSPGQSAETAVLEAPISVGGAVHARLVLSGKADGEPFTAGDEAAATALARAAGIALERAYEHGTLAMRARRLEIVTEAACGLLGGTSVSETLERVAEHVHMLADADLVAVTLPDDDGVHQIIEVAVGFRAERVKGLLTVREGSVAGEVLRTGHARVFTGTEQPAEQPGGFAAGRYAELGVGPALVLPMSADGQVRGVLAVCRSAEREPFDPQLHEVIARLADEAARVFELADRRLDDERVQLYQDRERIARDLHDLVVQRLFGVCMALEGVRNLSQRADVTARLGQSIDELDDTIRQIRSTIFALQTTGSARADAPLRHRIIQEVDAARQVLGFSVALRMEGLIDTDVPPAVAEHVIAVLREALTNVARHAQARRVEVDIVVGDRVAIEIVDDGLGPSASVHRSGLDNLARRAEQFAGALTVEPVRRHGHGRGTGTRIRWHVPLR